MTLENALTPQPQGATHGALVTAQYPLAIAISENPRAEIRSGLLVIGMLASLLAGWTALAPLDAAATASGKISVAGHNQVVQHREGGIVASLGVVEGQRVAAGQLLVELAPEEVGAQVKSLRSQVISLQAQRARLNAELQGAPEIAWPRDFELLSGDDRAAAEEAMRNQQALFEAGMRSLQAQRALNDRRAQSLREQIGGMQGQLDANSRQQTLLGQQLKGVRTLAEKGYASQNSVRALERSAADLTGSHGQYVATIADYRQQIMGSLLQSRGAEAQRAEAAAAALRETQDQLNTVQPRLEAVRGQLQRGSLRAQTDGVVTGLTVFREGSLVAPGQKLLEVVPTHPTLTVEARIASADIEGVRVGQRAEVRFMSLSARRVPVLSGVLTQLSADSFTDERTGTSYYTAQVRVPKSELDMVRRIRGADSAIRPGVPVQVMIPLRKRTALEYLFEPLTQSLWNAFRQR